MSNQKILVYSLWAFTFFCLSSLVAGIFGEVGSIFAKQIIYALDSDENLVSKTNSSGKSFQDKHDNPQSIDKELILPFENQKTSIDSCEESKELLKLNEEAWLNLDF